MPQPTDPEVRLLDERFVRMCGEYTAVVWNARGEEVTERFVSAGIPCQTKTIRFVPVSGPYIDFVALRETDGETWVDEDSPVQGGLSPAFAAQIREELAAAIAYLNDEVTP